MLTNQFDIHFLDACGPGTEGILYIDSKPLSKDSRYFDEINYLLDNQLKNSLSHHIEKSSPKNIWIEGKGHGKRFQFLATAGDPESIECFCREISKNRPIDFQSSLKKSSIGRKSEITTDEPKKVVVINVDENKWSQLSKKFDKKFPDLSFGLAPRPLKS